MRGRFGITRLFMISTVVLSSACLDPGAIAEGEDPALGTAESAVYTASLSASPASVELGQKVTVTWSTVAEHNYYDWVGMYKVGAADNAWLTYQYVASPGQTSGTMLFTVGLTPALDPGPYEFRYFSGGIKLATSNSVTGYANYALTGTPGSVELGQ